MLIALNSAYVKGLKYEKRSTKGDIWECDNSRFEIFFQLFDRHFVVRQLLHQNQLSGMFTSQKSAKESLNFCNLKMLDKQKSVYVKLLFAICSIVTFA